MCLMLVTGAMFYRIEAGLVYCEGRSADDLVNTVMPIADFRASIASGQKALDDFDAEHGVFALRG